MGGRPRTPPLKGVAPHSRVLLSQNLLPRLLRYLKKNENRYRKKNTDITDISIFFRDCILLNFMQNLLNFMQ
jgi:hypothetical protein